MQPQQPSRAIVIGAGLGGLASAMRLGAKGYDVTVIDRLDKPGGRGSSISQGGHRFDLGPTIVTVPQGLRDLWAACGRNFDQDVTLKALDPFYLTPEEHAVHLDRPEYRAQRALESLGAGMGLMNWVLASIKIDFQSETFYGSDVVATVTGMRPGNTSLTIDCQMTQDGRNTAFGRAIMVHLGEESGGPAPIPDALREILAEYPSAPD